MKPCLSSSPVPAYPPVPRFVRCSPPRKAVLTVNGKTPDEFGNVVIVVADIGDVGDILDHINNANNPHGTTAAQVGTYTAAEIDDKIGRSEAHYLTADAAGNAFATAAALKSATAFYYAGQLHTPDKNDYLTVLSDEDHPTTAGLNPTTRYAFVGIYAQGGHFVYQYTINDNAFTNAQLAAINSGINADKVTKIAQNESDILAEICRATHEEARLQGAINEIKTFEVVVADSLPDPSEQYRKKLYLIPSTNPETRNVKDEFICIEHDGVWSWEQIGSTKIDLTDYVKDDESYESVKDGASKGASHANETGNPHRTTAEEIKMAAESEVSIAEKIGINREEFLSHAGNESLHVSEYQKQSFADKYTKAETDAIVDPKRDKTDNVCHENSYSDWVFGGGAEGMLGVSVTFFPSSEGSENGDWLISVHGDVNGHCSGKKNDLHLDFENYNSEVFNYQKPTADRKKIAEKDEAFVTKFYVDGVASELVKKPTTDAPTVLLDSVNGCFLEVGTRNDDAGGALKVGNHIGGIIEVGSAEEGAAEASIKKNGKEVATESQLSYSHNTTTELKDRAFNARSFDGTEYNLTTALSAVTPTVEGAPRDLLIVAVASAATTISYTAGTIKGDKPTIDGEGKWLITLTEYEPNTWYCRQIKMEDAQ